MMLPVLRTRLQVLSLVLPALGLAIVPALAQGDFQKGISYYKQGNCQKAVGEFEEIVKANPKYEDGFRILGDCYLTLRNYTAAVDNFREALKLRSDYYPTYYGLAVAYFNGGKYQDAASTLQRAERLLGSADSYKFHHLRGSALYNSKQYAAAVADLSEAVRQRVSKEDLLQLGQAYQEIGNLSEAQKAFARALTLDPGNRVAQEALSDIELRSAADLVQQSRFAEAISVLSEYVRKNPASGPAFYNLGLAYLFTDRFKEAEDAFTGATRLAASVAAFDRLGFVQEKQKKYPQALASYKSAGELGSPQAADNIKRVQQRMAQGRSGAAGGQ